MLGEDDLDAAVAAGIVTGEQAASLRALAARRAKDGAVASGPEERFNFLRSFNDLFFAIGVALLGGGIAFFTIAVPAHSLLAAAIVWALSELLVARRRLVLPGILLVCSFVVFMLSASPIDFWFMPATQWPIDIEALRDWFTRPRMAADQMVLSTPVVTSIYALAGAAAALLFYARFRLPFALLPVAAGLVVALLAAMHHHWPRPPEPLAALVLFGCGFLVFAAAMAFDTSDRERTTRRADCAFWLHLLAAPLIVHSLIKIVWSRPPGTTRLAADMTTTVAVVVALILAVLTLVAIIIDRRALLVSALTYVGVVIGYALAGTIRTDRADDSVVFFATLVVLGALVLMLGVGWQQIRRRLVALLPLALAGRLPPVVVARSAQTARCAEASERPHPPG
jgi:hypothetical protein